MRKNIKEALERGWKICATCGEKKPVDDFYIRKDLQKNGEEYVSIRNSCKECVKAKIRLKATGWSPEDYERAWVLQGGKCAICGCELGNSRYTKPAADHDHKTGKLRGILCMQCNTALGLFKDSPYRLESAIHYLEEHGNNC